MTSRLPLVVRGEPRRSPLAVLLCVGVLTGTGLAAAAGYVLEHQSALTAPDTRGAVVAGVVAAIVVGTFAFGGLVVLAVAIWVAVTYWRERNDDGLWGEIVAGYDRTAPDWHDRGVPVAAGGGRSQPR